MVSLIDCRTYDLETVCAAVERAWDLAGCPSPDGKTVLLKPNMLRAAAPELAVTTHPAVVRASVRLMKARGAKRVLVGDSPGWQPPALAASASGLLEAAKAEGGEWADFTDSVSLESPGGLRVRRFTVARAAAEADMVVSLPKLKTHSLMYYTGAAKNLFGVIPGIQKSAFHMRFPGREEFGAMICDLVLALKPAAAIMDAIVGMEGPGPNNGKPIDIGLVMASPGVFPVDWVASALVGYRQEEISYLHLAATDPRYGFNPASAATEGEDPKARHLPHFERVKILKENDFFRKHLPSWAYTPMKNLLVSRPVFLDKLCIRCAACVKICPADALAFRDGKTAPAVDYEKCIRCYCCHEVCPVDAIALKRGLFR